jgi:hypothetical protein
MAACEDCWGEAYWEARRTGRMQADVYHEVLQRNDAAHLAALEPDDDGIHDPDCTCGLPVGHGGECR